MAAVPATAPPVKRSWLNHHLLAGVASGVFTAMTLHPLDLLKVRMQVQDGALHARRYTSVVHAARTIWAEEGLHGFYRGVVPGCAGSGASWGLYFFFYERCKSRLLTGGSDSLAQTLGLVKRDESAGGATAASGAAAGAGGGKPTMTSLGHMYAAWEGGTITCFFTNPIWLVKTRMQLQTNALEHQASRQSVNDQHGLKPKAPEPAIVPYRGTFDALRRIASEEGILAWYKGLTPALFLVSHGMVQFGVYEECKRRIAVIQGARARSAAAAGVDAAAAAAGGGGVGVAAGAPTRGGGGSVGGGGAWGWIRDEVSLDALYFGAGMISKAAATVTTYPYQVIKARMQQRQATATATAGLPTAAAPLPATPVTDHGRSGHHTGNMHDRLQALGRIATHRVSPYRSVVSTIRYIWGNEGARGFYKGFSANLLRVAPQSALTLVAYERVKALLDALD